MTKILNILLVLTISLSAISADQSSWLTQLLRFQQPAPKEQQFAPMPSFQQSFAPIQQQMPNNFGQQQMMSSGNNQVRQQPIMQQQMIQPVGQQMNFEQQNSNVRAQQMMQQPIGQQQQMMQQPMGQQQQMMQQPMGQQQQMMQQPQQQMIQPMNFGQQNVKSSNNMMMMGQNQIMPNNNMMMMNQQNQRSNNMMMGQNGMFARQQELVGCESNPCLNEGVCTQGLNGGFSCKCPWGWTGVRCEICLTECASNPCPSNKKCKAKFGGGFECICPADKAGQNCEIQNDLCASSPCLNGGICKPVEGGSFTCECAKPWAGSQCEQMFQNPCNEEVLRRPEVSQFKNPWDRHSYLICVDINIYHSMPCSVGTYFNENLHHCVPEGYDPPVCPPNFCQNDGECIVDESNLLKCACRKGFSGERCEVNIDECLLEGNAACAGGRCIDQVNGYYCQCSNGIGINCRDVIANPCITQNLESENVFFELPSQKRNVYLHCTSELQFTVSKCADNLFWHPEEKTCSVERPPLRAGLCMGAPCKNGGECQETPNGIACLCKVGYTGEMCEQVIDNCLSNPCQNGGKCLSYAGGYTCVCPDKIVDDCCCNGIVNPCPPKSKIVPGVNNYFPHLFKHKYIHCDFQGRAFVKTCAPKTKWNQDVLSCLPEDFGLNQTLPVLAAPAAYGGIGQQAYGYGQTQQQQPQYSAPAPQQPQPQVQYGAPAPQPQFIAPVPQQQPQYSAPAPQQPQPQYSEPAPQQPQYSEPAPQQPQPQYSEPAPQQPQPQYSEPAPQQPQPQYSEPAPQQPQPQYSEPAPQQPQPQYSEPAPQQPQPQYSEPAPQQPQPQYSEPAPQQTPVEPQYSAPAPQQQQQQQPQYSAPAPQQPQPQFIVPAPQQQAYGQQSLGQQQPLGQTQQFGQQTFGNQQFQQVPVQQQQQQQKLTLSPQLLMQLLQSGVNIPDSLLAQLRSPDMARSLSANRYNYGYGYGY